jgi:hypothetical protein
VVSRLSAFYLTTRRGTGSASYLTTRAARVSAIHAPRALHHHACIAVTISILSGTSVKDGDAACLWSADLLGAKDGGACLARACIASPPGACRRARARHLHRAMRPAVHAAMPTWREAGLGVP